MKTTSRSLLLLLCVLLTACSTIKDRVTTGRDFDESKVSQIKKGVTTAEGIVALYGEPDAKEIVSPNQVMWHYTYLMEDHKIHSGMFIPEVEQTTGYKKRLDILLQDNTVINFTYVKAPVQSQKEHSAVHWGE